MSEKNNQNVDATGSGVFSGAPRSNQAAKKRRKTSSKTRLKSPSRAGSHGQRRSVGHAPRKKSRKEPSASPVDHLKSLTASPTTEGEQSSQKEPADNIKEESADGATPGRGGCLQSEAAMRSQLDREYDSPHGRLQFLKVKAEPTASPLSPIEPHGMFSESLPQGTWNKEHGSLPGSINASSRTFSRDAARAVMSDSAAPPQDPPQPGNFTDARQLSFARITETEPLCNLRSRGKIARFPENSSMLRLSGQGGSLGAVADIREPSVASERTLANTDGNKGEQACSAGRRDARATSLSKSAAGTSMSYRPMTYRGSVRLVRSGGDAEFLSIVVAIDVLFVLLTILVGLHFAAERLDKRNDTAQQGYIFCCKQEALRLAPVIDTAVNPCNNLYEYVCSNAQRTQVIHAKFASELENSVFYGPILSRSTAGELLRRYYKTCSDATKSSNLTLLAADVVTTLLDSGVVHANMTSRSVIGSFFSTILPHGGFFIVQLKFTQQSLAQTLTVKLAKPENLVACDHCEGIMQVVNQRMNTNFTREEVQRFGSVSVSKKLCSASTGDVQLLKTLFHTVEPRTIEMILNSSLLANSTFLSRMVVMVYCFDEISYLVSALAGTSHQPLSSAFLVVDASARLVRQLFVAIPEKERKTSFCETQVRTLGNLWNEYLVDYVATADKNIIVVNIYESVKAVVLKSFIDQKIFDEQTGEQRDAIDMIDRMLLVLPRDSLPAGRRLPSPEAISPNFPAHYYYMQRYEFLADRLRVVQDLPDSVANFLNTATRRGRKLYVPAIYYLSLRHASKWLSVLHFPRLGASLAAFMWHAVLYERDWSSNTASRIRGFTECFGSKYLVAEGFTLSHAQFFYLSWAFNNCLYDGPVDKDVVVNIPATSAPRHRAAAGGAAAAASLGFGHHFLVLDTSHDSHIGLFLTALTPSSAAFDDLGEALDAVLGSYRLGP
ncbi:hypothetical protein MTO96_047981 [Rhipicephalus appendiculatus]